MRRSLALLLAAACLTACRGGAPAPPLAPEAGAVRLPDPAETATVVGTVRFAGESPPREPVRMAGDHACSAAHSDEVLSRALLVDRGLVAGAVVHLVSDVSEWSFPAPEEPVVVDQVGCLFEPRVSAAQVGQEVVFLNSDPTFHNVRSITENNEAFNLILPQPGLRRSARFQNPEMFVGLKCDVHPWMSAQVAVVAHPFFALSLADGSFRIEGVPAGEHELEVRHEVLGSMRQRLRLEAGRTLELELVFPPDAGS